MDQPLKKPLLSKELVAAILVFLGTICFSAKAVLVKLAYQYEVDSISLLTLRMGFALPVFIIGAIWSGRKDKKNQKKLFARDWVTIFFLGVAGYYLASLLDFVGLNYISASMERLILFIYPTLVVVLSALFFRQKILREQYLALLLTYIGISIIFASELGPQSEPNFIKGALLIFFCALTFAIYLIGSGRLLPRIGTIRYTSLAMMAASFAIIIHHGFLHQWDLLGFTAEVYQLAILMAIISTVLPAFLVSEGIRIIGASNAAIIGSVGPISTIILAYIFLGERLIMLQWVGTVLVISGVLTITLLKKK